MEPYFLFNDHIIQIMNEYCGLSLWQCFGALCWARVSRQWFGIIRVPEHCWDMYWGIVGGNGLLYLQYALNRNKNPLLRKCPKLGSTPRHTD
jgi:hypothetical protein